MSNSSSSGSSEGARRSISVTRESVAPFAGQRFQGWRLRATASHERLMPQEIFLYERGTVSPDSADPADRFLNVCTPSDLAEYPTVNPSGIPSFYRRNDLDLVFRTREIADEAWAAIRSRVQSLVDSLNRMDLLTQVETEEFS